MSGTYKIVGFDGPPRDWEFQGNNFRSYYVRLEGDERRIELAQKPETPAPNIGDTLTGAITEKNGYFKFKKERSGGFSGAGPRPEDPQRAKRILRQHSQDMALRYAALRQSQGKLPDTFSFEDIQKLADRFDADAEAAAA